jgi:hypothetical protein
VAAAAAAAAAAGRQRHIGAGVKYSASAGLAAGVHLRTEEMQFLEAADT